jgi:hypothetical protein
VQLVEGSTKDEGAFMIPPMNTFRGGRSSIFLACAVWITAACALGSQSIPLPEHPRPDFERSLWTNLNGLWELRFDPDDAGLKSGWAQAKETFPRQITVPFPWGSPLSGVKDEAPRAWYARTVRIPEAWRGQRVFLVIGACDWETQGWLDGHAVGTHRGGYTPFEFDLTAHAQFGQEQRLVLRVDDTARSFKLEGKQGYGNARGIWQTVYLEARPQSYVNALRFVPDIDQKKATLSATFNAPLTNAAELRLRFTTGNVPEITQAVASGASEVSVDIPLPQARLWSLEDPFLYELSASLRVGDQEDRIGTYFGMRKISVMNLPGTTFPYIALNNRPIYLQITLDQSYHPEGFYTFPSDAFMRDEILRSRRIGLNANRLHVKVDVPRKLYWADRLGLLIMADVPNSWGEPGSEMRQDVEHAMRGMIQRDFNHPSIFSWVPFNETWGLFTADPNDKKKRTYLPETQEWVASIYKLAKQLDPTRLVEDNSPCNFDHVVTDINSWHAYLPGYAWQEHLDQVTRDTFPGSKWNFIGDRTQSNQPLLNSECGNVWGYEGSTGDCDWSWDYHIMMNEFRRHPKVCGWLYTEHHDVVNEWNGYYRYDRSEKFTGLEDILGGMTLRDLHAPFYIAPGGELCRDVQPGEKVSVPIWASFMTDHSPTPRLKLRALLSGVNNLGVWKLYSETTQTITFEPWLSKAIEPIEVKMPAAPALTLLNLLLEDEVGTVLQRNFCAFLVRGSATPAPEAAGNQRVLRFAPQSFRAAKWSQKQWNVMDGLKVNGAGHGYFEYRVEWPSDLDPSRVEGASLLFEASAKQLFGKDREGAAKQTGDFMLGEGTHDPSLNPNSYPMTDTVRFPSAVRVRVADQSTGVYELPDDPADHRGILSWHAQKRDKRLVEAGSYGYLIHATIPEGAVKAAAAAKEFIIRFEVDGALAGGLAIYGERFGRYPLDPAILLRTK